MHTCGVDARFFPGNDACRIARFLTTHPFGNAEYFSELIVQRGRNGEPVANGICVIEDRPAEVAALAVQHLNADTAYIANAKWDLWGSISRA